MRSVLLLSGVLLLAGVATQLTGCVLNSTYSDALSRWTQKNNDLQADIDTLKVERDTLLAETEALKRMLDTTSSELDQKSAKLQDLDQKVSEQDAQLASTKTQLDEVSEQASSLDAQAKKLQAERETLLKQREELAQEVKELRRLRAAAEARSAEYKNLLSKLKKMIDAGSLSVKIRNGLMLVTLPSDVLFAPGEATVKPEAKEALVDLAGTLKGIKDRRFQVVGHSDSAPINTEKFPSNWELSAARAVEVVKMLVEAGVQPKNLSAAGAASYDPVASNKNSKGRALNRRVELVFVPKIQELPGFEEVR